MTPTLRHFGALSGPGSYLGPQAGGPLVGRLVANTEFLRALFRYGSFETYRFFIGEKADADALRTLILEPGWLPPERLIIDHLLRLPTALARGEIDVLHHNSHVGGWNDLIALRDRHAPGVVPVTGQIHSLSYPRMIADHALALSHPPDLCDAIFCSSTAGREAVIQSFESARAQLQARGIQLPPLGCALPVVPLGVDVETLAGGDRSEARRALGVPEEAILLLSLGRFSEHDKMDLFPLVQVFAELRARVTRPIHLVMAGARQGTKTPEMLELWAGALGVGPWVHVRTDLTPTDKHTLLAAADVFVSPSDNVQETFGLAVVEAMAAGLPVVVSDWDGYKDTVPEHVGIRVPTRWACDPSPLREYGALLYERPLHLILGQSVEIDLGELEDTLVELCEDEERRQTLGRQAAIHARDRFDWSRVIPAYEAVWRELQSQPRMRAPGSPPPLGMDHGATFAHYPTHLGDPSRWVRRTIFADRLATAGIQHPIYPELSHLFDAADVQAALLLTGDAMPIRELRCLLIDVREAQSFDELLAVDLLIGWLLKHGLLGEGR